MHQQPRSDRQDDRDCGQESIVLGLRQVMFQECLKHVFLYVRICPARTARPTSPGVDNLFTDAAFGGDFL